MELLEILRRYFGNYTDRILSIVKSVSSNKNVLQGTSLVLIRFIESTKSKGVSEQFIHDLAKLLSVLSSKLKQNTCFLLARILSEAYFIGFEEGKEYGEGFGYRKAKEELMQKLSKITEEIELKH